jgi:glycerophosphoryl diester phosphodiesterase
VLALGEGTDTIVDFEVGVDFIGLADGLSFGSLSLTQNNGGVSISAGNESLANVDNITVGALNNEVNFISNFTAA